MQKKLIRNDLILIAAIVLVAVISFLYFSLTKKEGNTVLVNVDGKVIAEYSIAKDIKEEISTQYGENTLVIKNGNAYISDADCPDKICANHRAISKTGESIACLPHKLVITVE